MNAVAAPATESATLRHYRQLFESLPQATDPGRSGAFARFLAAGFPGARDEGWKYTSLRRLESRRAELPGPADATEEIAVDALAARSLRVVNGALPADLRPFAAAGLSLRGVSTLALAERPESRAAHRNRGAGRFAALNHALGGDGLLLEVAAGTQVDEPLHLAFLNAGPRSLLVMPRLHLRLGAGASLRLIVEHGEDGAAERFVASSIDAVLEAGARLELYRLQRLGDRSHLIESCDLTLGRDARVRVLDGNFGGALARLDLEIALEAPGASAEVHGVFLADGQRHLDTQVRIDHLAPHTESEQLFRGIAAGRGRGVLLGKAVVHPGAQKAVARQSLRSLLLSVGAEIDVKPDLEIYADDVQCSHGATIGQLDPQALFYLRSRGLAEAEARRALTRAFAGAVLAGMQSLPAYERAVHALVDRRLDGLLVDAP